MAEICGQMALPLFHRIIGDAHRPPLLILHGLLGSSDNWQTLAKRYAETHAVHLLDARNHGRSPHDPVHSYAAMVDDVIGYLDGAGLEKASVLGHSMGGKTALMLGLEHPERVEKLVVADMAARAYPIHHQPIFDALLSVDVASVQDRSVVEAHLASRLGDASIVAFLMKGLRRLKDGGYAWRANLPVLNQALADVVGSVELSVNTLPMLAIYGKRSSYVSADDLAAFDRSFLQFESHGIEGAGHWLHAEHPEEFFEVTVDFLT